MRANLLLLISLLIGGWAQGAAAQSINGSALALRSNGTAAGGGGWTLNDNGYVGSYITLAAPGEVTISVQASGQAAASIDPRMTIAVGDISAPFEVGAGFEAYQHTFALPVGTHFVRTGFTNDAEKSSRALTIGSLAVRGAQ